MAKAEKPRGIRDIIAGASLRETTVPLCLAGHLQGEYDDLERQLADAAATVGQSLAGGDRAGIAQRLEAVRAEMAEHLVTFRFRALGDTAWSDLLAEHPGRDAGEMWNPTTLGPAAIAACAIDPVMTVEEYQELAALLTHGQQEALLGAVWDLNTKVTSRVPFSLLASATAASPTGEK